MDPYWLFLKTVVNTMVSLIGAAAVLFTSGPQPDLPRLERPPVLRAAFAVDAPAAGDATPAVPQDAQASGTKTHAMIVDALVGAMKDTDAGVRRHAAIALAELEDTRAVPALIEALGDKDREVRRAAVTALGELGDQRAIEPLTRAMKDEDPEVRRRAIVAIAELSDGDGDARNRGWRDVPNPRPMPNPNPNPNPRPRPSGV